MRVRRKHGNEGNTLAANPMKGTGPDGDRDGDGDETGDEDETRTGDRDRTRDR